MTRFGSGQLPPLYIGAVDRRGSLAEVEVEVERTLQDSDSAGVWSLWTLQVSGHSGL